MPYVWLVCGSLSYHYSSCHHRVKALYYSSQAALLCFNTHRFSEGTSFIKNSLRHALKKNDLLGLRLIVESGLNNIDEFIKHSVASTMNEGSGVNSPCRTVSSASTVASRVAGSWSPVGRQSLQPVQSVYVYRDRLLAIKRRLTEAYLSMGCCAIKCKAVSPVLLWVREKLHRSDRVHP